MHAPRARALALAASTMPLLASCAGDLKPGAKSIFDLARTPSPAEAADMALDPYDPDRRYKGLRLLANAPFAGEEPYLALFQSRLADEDPGVRAAAVRALANHAPPDQVPLLLAALDDPDLSVRLEAAKGLQRLHNPIAIDPLIKHLSLDQEPEPDVRAEAATALAQYAQPKVLEALFSALAPEQQLLVNRRALESLRTLTGQDFALSRADWVAWSRAATSPFAARAAFFYPIYSRPKTWWEHIPFVPPPPNEVAALPAGFPPSFTP